MAIRSLESKKEDESKEKQKLIQISEISLMLNDYEDIFSDFDARSHAQKALSQDFLEEAKRASKEKVSGQIELKLSVPGKIRDYEKEKIIKNRLHEHFKKHYPLLNEEKKGILKTGIILALSGITMMLISSYLRYLAYPQFLFHLLFVLLEPAGWFMTWYGLDRIFYVPEEKKSNLEFYEKMAKSEIIFLSY